MTRAVVAAVGALLALAPGLAHAQDQPMERDFELERFHLAGDRDGVLGVDWAGIPAHGSFDIGWWLGTSNDLLVVYLADDRRRERVGALVAQRSTGNLVASVALFERVQLGASVPVVFAQSDQGAPLMTDGAPGTGLGDVHLRAELGALRQQAHGLDVALAAAVTVPTGADDAFVGEKSVTLVPALLVSRQWGGLRLAGNAAYRVRENVRLANLTVADELLLKVGVGFRFEDVGGPPLELDAMLSAATPAGDPFAADNQDHSELIGGLQYRLGQPMVLIMGAGVGLHEGFGTPDWRAFLGLRYSQRQYDSDGDGLIDRLDSCPDAAEDRDGYLDMDGCPDPDNDGDGLLDAADGAPLEPEDRDGFQDDDGIPDPDNDGDGVADELDRCPLEPETVNDWQDLDGCPDTMPDEDGDGFADGQDGCPDRAEDVDGHEDNDGCPDLDDDGDGVPDTRDDCRLEPGPVAMRGCPDRDRDGDGVVDRLDNCPDEAGSAERAGCQREQLVALRDDKVEILERVFFATGRARLRERSHAVLDNVAAVLAAHPEIPSLRIEGHTDATGTATRNLELSQQRADAVRDYLIAAGVDAGRLVAVGFGESMPVADNRTRRGRADNRRVEFVIVRDGGNGVSP